MAIVTRSATRRGISVLVAALLGIVVGGVIGEAASESIPLLARGASIELDPSSLDLVGVIGVTFGFSLNVNIASVLAIIVFVFLLRYV